MQCFVIHWSEDLVSIVGMWKLCRVILWLLTLIDSKRRAYPEPLLIAVLAMPCTKAHTVQGVMGAATQLIFCLPSQMLEVGLNLLGRRGTFFLLLTIALTVRQTLQSQGCLPLKKSFSCSPEGII